VFAKRGNIFTQFIEQIPCLSIPMVDFFVLKDDFFFPMGIMSIPTEGMSIPKEDICFPMEVISFPKEDICFPMEVMTFPKGHIGFLMEVMSVPMGNMSFPKLRFYFKNGCFCFFYQKIIVWHIVCNVHPINN